MMKKSGPIVLLVYSLLLSGCDAATRDDFFGGSRSGGPATAEELSDIIERLLPETATT